MEFNKKQIKVKLEETFARSNFKDITQEISNENIYNGVYLFFSFDLVNSTAFKARYISNWQNLFTRFYELIEAYLKKKYSNISLWKYVGDEVLLYLKVTDMEQLYDVANNVSNIIEETTNKLYDEVPASRKIIFIKSSLWIANVHFLTSRDVSLADENTSVKNIAFFTGSVPEWLQDQTIDFLGPDIDLGFRLGKHTQKSKILISAELAYILNRKKGDIESYQRENNYKVSDRLKIISFEKMKGIWEGRRYPIIWFSEVWDSDAFDYDEHLESSFVSNIIEGKTLSFEKIGKVFDDLGKTEELEDMIRIIENTSADFPDTHIRYDISKDRLAEVHCAAICFNEAGEILLAKRSQYKNRLKGLWEFGCGQLEINQTVKECLLKNYLKDFNVQLSFINDTAIPVTTYEFKIEPEERTVPGLLFLALIENPADVTPNNHEEVKWISKEELETIKSEDCVEGLDTAAHLAFNIFNQNNS